MVLTCKDKNQIISIQAYHHNLIKYKKTDTFFIIKNNENNVTEMINENINKNSVSNNNDKNDKNNDNNNDNNNHIKFINYQKFE